MRNPISRSSFVVVMTIALTACDGPQPAATRAPADPTAGETAFELAGPGGAAIIVPVTINGQGPFRLVLDTGATLTCLDETVVARLGLREARGVGMGASVGGRGQVRLVRVDSLSVGAASAAELTACALDLAHIQDIGIEMDGLLGLNFLQSFQVTLDFERNVLVLVQP